jgi:hypothetical protein
MTKQIVLVVLILWSHVSNAADESITAKSDHFLDTDYGKFIMLEFAVGVTSSIAASDPEGFGDTVIVLSPLFAAMGMESGFTWPKFIFGTAFLAGYGAWNKSMRDEKKSEVFRNNMIFFNALYLTAWSMNKYSEYRVNNSNNSQNNYFFYLSATKENIGLSFVKKFN